MCQKINAKAFIETSAKLGINISELFNLATKFSLSFKPVKVDSNECCSLQ